ncbi:hypothetical protein DPMN_077074 [Dreissena polymorpha]|uniref:Uncharacterized protein n=1 Tax=Dreissena polymorpha TaxID=45954 RepID=A0A9D3YPW1_DREPO|nr:hypothetical protein DPMN_077074 [Dreissena polymorpha]
MPGVHVQQGECGVHKERLRQANVPVSVYPCWRMLSCLQQRLCDQWSELRRR